MIKRFVDFTLIPWVFKILLTAIAVTCRVRVQGQQHADQLKASDKTWIYAFWHNNITCVMWTLRGSGMRVMVSDSRDGEIIERCSNKFGYSGIRGSSSAGSAKATRGLLKVIKNNQLVGITPDGPRGPIYQAQPGVLWLSAASGVAVLPYHAECSRQWTFNSWDKHKVPKPFSTIYVSIGEPIYIDKSNLKADEEAVKQAFEEAMRANQEQALKMRDSAPDHSKIAS